MNETFEEMLRRYQAEMMQYAPAAKAVLKEELPALEKAEPASLAPESKAEEPPYLFKTETERAEEPTLDTDTATLTVQVYTAGGALPVEGATVTVTRPKDGQTLLSAVLYTDSSGRTAAITLPAPPAEDSNTPEAPHPFASYNIRTDKDGYYSVANLSVPLFGGIDSLQPVEMIPIPERETDVTTIQIFEGEAPGLSGEEEQL